MYGPLVIPSRAVKCFRIALYPDDPQDGRMGLTGGNPPPAKKFGWSAKLPGGFWSFPGKWIYRGIPRQIWLASPGIFPDNADGRPGNFPGNPRAQVLGM